MFERKLKSGVSFVELIVVIAIILIIAGVSFPVGAGFVNRTWHRNTVNELVSSLRTAQINSFSGKEDRSWGVNVTSNQIILFAVGDSSFDQTFDIPASVNVTIDTITFDEVTGNPDATVNLTVSNDLGDSVNVSVNEVGVVDVN